MSIAAQVSHFRILAADFGMGGDGVHQIAAKCIDLKYISEDSVSNEFGDVTGHSIGHVKIGADNSLSIEMLKGTSIEDLDRAIGVLMDELEFRPPVGETLLDVFAA
ncbi:hypothetical protein [Micromonospora sp. NPDC005367]|uniref:hypothetical protein n=1 Tax=Micromonospora sp. NPDC005367 TaxID=3155590 RepID=UPI0033B8300C